MSGGSANGAVTWKALVATVISSAAVVLAATASVDAWKWSVHASHPHKGAITEGEYRQDQRQRDDQIKRIFSKLDSVDNKLDRRFDGISDKVDSLLKRGS